MQKINIIDYDKLTVEQKEVLSNIVHKSDPLFETLSKEENIDILCNIAKRTDNPEILSRLSKHPDGSVRYEVIKNENTDSKTIDEMLDSAKELFIIQMLASDHRIGTKALWKIVKNSNASYFRYLAFNPKLTMEMEKYITDEVIIFDWEMKAWEDYRKEFKEQQKAEKNK